MVIDAIRARVPDVEISETIIRTSGDWSPEQGEQRLSEKMGGKGAFVHEIERVLSSGVIDVGVHSAKDVETYIPDDLDLAFTLPRDDWRDAFVSRKYPDLDSMPAGAVVVGVPCLNA